MPKQNNQKDIEKLIKEIKQIDTTLGDREVEIIVYKELTNMTHQEIADKLGIKKGTVEAHLYTEIDKSIKKVLNTIDILDKIQEKKGKELEIMK